jgi:hypothetical protein
MEGRIRFFFSQFIFYSSILNLISISIVKKDFLGHTDNLTDGNDKIFFKSKINLEPLDGKVDSIGSTKK